GRVAKLDSEKDGEATFLSKDGQQKFRISTTDLNMPLVRENQGTLEIGDCYQRDMSSLLPTKFKGTKITWTTNDLQKIHRLFGQEDDQAGYAYMCSDPQNSGRLALSIGANYKASLTAAYETLEEDKDHGGFDDLKYKALLESLRIASGAPE